MIAEAPSKIRSTAVGDAVGSARMPALDALRGIASLAVVWYHVYRYSALPELLQLPPWADLALRFGFLGVSDVDIGTAFALMTAAALLLYAVAVGLMNRGVGIRE